MKCLNANLTKKLIQGKKFGKKIHNIRSPASVSEIIPLPSELKIKVIPGQKGKKKIRLKKDAILLILFAISKI